MQKEIEFIESKINKDTILVVVSFLIAVVGLSMPLNNELTRQIGVFLLVSGSLFSGIKLYFLIQHERIKNDFYAHALEVSRVQNGLQVPASKLEIDKPQSREHIVYLDKVNDDGQHQTELRRYNEKNRPPRDFIIACHALAMTKEKNHVPERTVIGWLKQHTDWDRWNVWLDEMEKVGILKLEDSREHAARYWDIANIQLSIALDIFEYEPTPSPTNYVSPSDSPTRMI